MESFSVNHIYRDILQRIEKADTAKPNPLRRPITELLINRPAVQPHDGCPPVSDKVARYKLANGTSLAHEFQTAQNWWVAPDRLPSAFHSRAEYYPEGRSRNSNLKCMADLAEAAAYKVKLESEVDATKLLNALLAV